MDKIIYQPIGFFRSSKKHPFEAARQPAYDISSEEAYIELLSGHNFEQALTDLKTFSHLWIIFHFHKNETWKPMVLPPVGSKKGVFATRSPYRPNGIGISAAQLQKVEGLRIYITHYDILDGSPILDLKPYVPEYDHIPFASRGWIESASENKFEVQLNPTAKSQLNFLTSSGLQHLENFIENQLQFEPTNNQKKRVKPTGSDHQWILSYRTWRILFQINLVSRTITIEKIFSAYTPEELAEPLDPYNDKSLHQSFTKIYEQTKAPAP